MDWGDPAGVVMSHGTAAVLRAMAGAEGPFTVRQLARIANISPNRARQAVARLAEHGVLIVDSSPGLHLVRLNRDHLAAEPSIELATLRARVLDRLREEVASWPLPAVHVSLFGSAARGDGSTTSDIDLLAVHASFASTSEQEGWDNQLAHSAVRVERWTGNWVSWFQISQDDLNQMNANDRPIMAEWRRDAVTLFGPPIMMLLRGAS